MIYLACPYSSPDITVRNWRYHRAKSALFGLWTAGIPAICSIVLGHEYEQRSREGPRELPHDFWMLMARAQLACCTGVYVLTLPGWRQSEGVRMEVQLAVGMGRPVQGYAPIQDCEEVSGLEILAEFGIKPPRRPRLVLPPRKDDEEDDEDA